MDRDVIDNDIVLSTNIQPCLVLYTSVDRDVNDDDKTNVKNVKYFLVHCVSMERC